jgi:hypothetical protein
MKTNIAGKVRACLALALISLTIIALCFSATTSNATNKVTDGSVLFGAIPPDPDAASVVPDSLTEKSLAVSSKIVQPMTADAVSRDALVIPSIVNNTPSAFSGYMLPVPGPNDQVLSSFPIWRDTFGNGFIQSGGTNFSSTPSRLNDPTGIEIRDCFSRGDVAIPQTGTTNHLWQGTLDSTNPAFANELGGHGYVSPMFVGNVDTNGVRTKLTLHGISYRVVDQKGILDNKSSLVTNDYSVSRVGIIAGPSGNPFANDAILIKSGSGDTPVDAIWFIGGRFGVWVNGQAGLDAFNAYIPEGGEWISYVYSYQWQSTNVIDETDIVTTNIQSCEKIVWLYRQGQIPLWYQPVQFFQVPTGFLFSLFCKDEGEVYTMYSRRQLDIGHWNLESSAAVTGWSKGWAESTVGINSAGFLKVIPDTNTINLPGIRL